MMWRARDGGASRRARVTTCLFLALASQLFPSLAGAAGLRLLRASPATVRATALAAGADAASSTDTLQLQLVAGTERHDLRLRPKTSLGALTGRLRGRAVAYQGHVQDRAGSWVAITRIGSNWSGVWFDGLHYYGIDSAAALAAVSRDADQATPATQLVFRLADAVWENASFAGDTRMPAASAEGLVDLVGAELSAATALQAALPTRRLQVALLADSLQAQRDGASTEANMLAQLNVVDGIFSSQVGVQLQSSSVTIFTAGNDPFTATTDSSALLGELATYRSNSTQQRSAGLSHLTTGRDLDGQTVGIAYLSALCSAGFGASLAQSANLSNSLAALVAAHEIGHVFGAPHDAEAASACESTATGYLMSPSLNGASGNASTFSACSLTQIAPQVQMAQCLAPAEAADAAVDAPSPVQLALNRATDATINVNSVGTATVNGTSLRIVLPVAITLVSATGPTATCTASSNIVTCTLGSIAPGGTSSVTLRLLATTAGASAISARVSATNDGLATNNATTLQLNAAEGLDVGAAISADPSTLIVGANSTATFTLSNLGPATADDARLSITLPNGLTLLQQTPDGLVCATVTAGLSCGPMTLAAGAAARVVLVLRTDLSGSRTLDAVASTSRPELQTGNDRAQLTLVVNAVPVVPPAPKSGGGGAIAPLGLAALLLLRGGLNRRRCRRRAHRPDDTRRR
jgi:hypothetical protein